MDKKLTVQDLKDEEKAKVDKKIKEKIQYFETELSKFDIPAIHLLIEKQLDTVLRQTYELKKNPSSITIDKDIVMTDDLISKVEDMFTSIKNDYASRGFKNVQVESYTFSGNTNYEECEIKPIKNVIDKIETENRVIYKIKWIANFCLFIDYDS